jgi:Arc/MetJ-type ribon-helix-helix transcriptional regulator
MNFSVHLTSEMVRRLDERARDSGKKRNALIREAIAEWLDRTRVAKWPPIITEFRGIRGLRRFEAERKHLKPPREPFDAFSA